MARSGFSFCGRIVFFDTQDSKDYQEEGEEDEEEKPEGADDDRKRNETRLFQGRSHFYVLIIALFLININNFLFFSHNQQSFCGFRQFELFFEFANRSLFRHFHSSQIKNDIR